MPSEEMKKQNYILCIYFDYYYQNNASMRIKTKMGFWKYK